jgi:hypothetical protein
MSTSQYGDAFFATMGAGTGGAAVGSLALALAVALALSRCSPSGAASAPGIVAMGCVALLVAVAQTLWSVAAAVAAGVGAAPAGAMFVVAAVPLAATVPLGVAAMSPALWRLDPADGGAARCCTPVVAAVRAVTVKPSLTWALACAAMSAIALAMLGLQGACFCSDPIEASTWASRRASPPTCADASLCHAYALLGPAPDSLVVVAHWVSASSSSVVGAAQLVVCAVAQPLAAACDNASWTVPASRIVPYSYDAEDVRTLLHFALIGLTPGQGYRVHVRALDGGGALLGPGAARTLWLRALPGPSDSVTPISFVAGGGFRVGGPGARALAAGLRAAPDSGFLVLAGDLGFGNNMRTCYRRWDRALAEFAGMSVTNAAGWHLPLVVVAGDHDAGGFVAGAARVHFLREYFPHAPSAAGAFHAHEIGAGLGVAAVDSECTSRVADQATPVGEALRNWTTARAAAGMAPRVPLFVYHAAAFARATGATSAGFPTQGSVDDGAARAALRTSLMPLLERFNVSVAFEAHQLFAYRTRELDAAGAVVPDASGRRGTVFVGCGGLGAAAGAGAAPDRSTGILAAAISGVDFAAVATFFAANRSLRIALVSPSPTGGTPTVIDSADVSPRG